MAAPIPVADPVTMAAFVTGLSESIVIEYLRNAADSGGLRLPVVAAHLRPLRAGRARRAGEGAPSVDHDRVASP